MSTNIPIYQLDLVNPEDAAAIQTFIQQHDTLEKLILASASIVSMISQDEFTSDLVLLYADSVYLVYDVT